MALVSNGFWLVVTLRDNGGNETTKTYQMVAADADTAATDAAAVLTALNAVTDAVVVSYFAYERFIEAAFSYPGDGVQVENLALLDFDLVDHPEKTATVTIPAPNIGIFVASSGSGANIVDTSDAALVTFRDLFRTGGKLLISDGEVAESLVRGRRIHRKSLRG
jgi:hypothetical protein